MTLPHECCRSASLGRLVFQTGRCTAPGLENRATATELAAFVTGGQTHG